MTTAPPPQDPASALGSDTPPEPPTVPVLQAAAAPPPRPEASPQPAPVRQFRRPPRRPRWVTALRVIALVIALPVAAVAIGLLIAWIVHEIRGGGSSTGAANPTASASPSPASSPAPTAKASRPAVVIVPTDWVPESAPPEGLAYRHPPGWLRRLSTPEVLRLEPAAPGSTAPGIEGVGAGTEAASSPADALTAFASRTYGAQPGYVAGVPSAAGSRAGERQVVFTYRRVGVDVRVVARSFRVGGRTVLVIGRAATASGSRAAQLEALVEASLQLTS